MSTLDDYSRVLCFVNHARTVPSELKRHIKAVASVYAFNRRLKERTMLLCCVRHTHHSVSVLGVRREEVPDTSFSVSSHPAILFAERSSFLVRAHPNT